MNPAEPTSGEEPASGEEPTSGEEPVFAKVSVFAKVEGKLMRWEAVEVSTSKAISLVRDLVGLSTVVLAMLESDSAIL